MPDGSPWPRISVVTPSYNQAAFLEETIRSVLGQGYPNLEYIVVDGGSDDGSVEVIEKYAPWLAHWVSEKDRGQTHALNKGFARATGEIFAYLNSDDLYLPGALRAVAIGFANHPEADVLYGRIEHVLEDGTLHHVQAARIHSLADLLDVWNVWARQLHLTQPEVFWRRRIHERCGPLREELHYVMDYEYWLRVASLGARFVYLPEELARFRHTDQQKTTDKKRVAHEQFGVMREYLWDSAAALSGRDRRRLQADWLFKNRLRSAYDEAVEDELGRARRWTRVLGALVRHPKILFFSREFRKFVRHWAFQRGWAATDELSEQTGRL